MKQSVVCRCGPRTCLPAGVLAVSLMAFGASARAAESSGNATLTTDYVWRGATQTQGDPAIQAGFKVMGNSGLYASIWGSNVEFAPETHASSEFDFNVGWNRKVSDRWAFDVNVLNYRYPATAVDLNWTELSGAVTYADNYWLSVGYSPEVLGTDAVGIYTQVGARFPIHERLRFEAVVGHYFLEDAYGDSYTHGQLNAIWAFKRGFEFRLSAHGTDSRAKAIFGDKLAGTRLEAALQAAF
jgi:uncharacterized protein (TIGR02001 family)